MPTDYLVSTWGKNFFQSAVEDKDLTTPPGSPVKAKRYIVGGSATGAWSGHDDDIAMFDGVVWVFATPKEGWFVYVKDEDTFYLYTTSWAEFSAGGIASLVEDTSPQLGGELDCRAHSVGFTAQTATGDGTTTIDWRLGNKMHFTHGAMNDTFTFTAPTKPCNLIHKITQDGVGGRDCTFPGSVTWLGLEPTWADGGANKSIIVAYYWDGTTYWAIGSPWEI